MDKVKLRWQILMLVQYSSSGGQGKFGWWMLMLVLYSSSSGLGKVWLMDAYVGAV